jgi:hypothetical protein
VERGECGDFRGRLIISLILDDDRKASQNSCFRDRSRTIKRGLVTCGRKRVLRKRRIGKLTWMHEIKHV